MEASDGRGLIEGVERARVDQAVADARSWGQDLGPAWQARLDQLHAQVRTWAERTGVDPGSYAFRATWCVATTLLHRMAATRDTDDLGEGATLARLADVVATVGLWGSSIDP